MKKVLFAVILGGILTSCTSNKTLYNWKNYDKAVYAYSETSSEESTDQLMETYNKLIENPGGTRMVPPPGVYADYGYLLIQKGKIDEGLELLKKEVALYPESNAFLQLVIKRIEE